jgi:dTDP-glucose 4,6-dehydratase/UDP-glucuronate decarboxylase
VTLLSLLTEDAERVAAAVDLKPLAGKAVLVTGGTGLIGLNLVAALCKSEAKAIMVASRNGFPAWAEMDDPRIIDLRMDQANPKAPRPDIVIHGAGYGQPAKFTAEPLETIRANTQMTDRLLQQLTLGGKFLFLSSSEVYSGSPRGPHLEGDIGTTSPDHARAAYIEAKRCGEAIVHAHRASGIDAKIGRISLAYGPGTRRDDGRVINQFCQQALTSGRILMGDSGSARRTYCYITDTVEMILNILLRGKEAVCNIANPSGTVTIRGLAEMISAELDVRVIAVPRDDEPGAAPNSVKLSMDRYQAEFGEKRFVGLDAGLARTIKFQRELYGC